MIAMYIVIGVMAVACVASLWTSWLNYQDHKDFIATKVPKKQIGYTRTVVRGTRRVTK